MFGSLGSLGSFFKSKDEKPAQPKENTPKTSIVPMLMDSVVYEKMVPQIVKLDEESIWVNDRDGKVKMNMDTIEETKGMTEIDIFRNYRKSAPIARITDKDLLDKKELQKCLSENEERAQALKTNFSELVDAMCEKLNKAILHEKTQLSCMVYRVPETWGNLTIGMAAVLTNPGYQRSSGVPILQMTHNRVPLVLQPISYDKGKSTSYVVACIGTNEIYFPKYNQGYIGVTYFGIGDEQNSVIVNTVSRSTKTSNDDLFEIKFESNIAVSRFHIPEERMINMKEWNLKTSLMLIKQDSSTLGVIINNKKSINNVTDEGIVMEWDFENGKSSKLTHQNSDKSINLPRVYCVSYNKTNTMAVMLSTNRLLLNLVVFVYKEQEVGTVKTSVYSDGTLKQMVFDLGMRFKWASFFEGRNKTEMVAFLNLDDQISIYKSPSRLNAGEKSYGTPEGPYAIIGLPHHPVQSFTIGKNTEGEYVIYYSHGHFVYQSFFDLPEYLIPLNKKSSTTNKKRKISEDD